jgi:hypothetical protein
VSPHVNVETIDPQLSNGWIFCLAQLFDGYRLLFTIAEINVNFGGALVHLGYGTFFSVTVLGLCDDTIPFNQEKRFVGAFSEFPFNPIYLTARDVLAPMITTGSAAG